MMDIDDELDALYRAARAQEAPTRADRSAVRAAVTSALAVTTVVASSNAAAGALATAVHTAKVATVGQLIGWLCAGAALGGVTSSVAWVAVPSPRSPVSVLPAAAPAALAAPAPAHAAKTSASARLVSAASVAPGPIRQAPRPRHQAARSTGSASRAAAAAPPHAVSRVETRPRLEIPSLSAESEGLQAIQRALADGDASRALELAAEQQSQFRAGVLAEERAVVRVLALCAAGRRDQARLARDRFVIAYPSSPHTKRVLGSCASDDGSAASGHGE